MILVLTALPALLAMADGWIVEKKWRAAAKARQAKRKENGGVKA